MQDSRCGVKFLAEQHVSGPTGLWSDLVELQFIVCWQDGGYMAEKRKAKISSVNGPQHPPDQTLPGQTTANQVHDSVNTVPPSFPSFLSYQQQQVTSIFTFCVGLQLTTKCCSSSTLVFSVIFSDWTSRHIIPSKAPLGLHLTTVLNSRFMENSCVGEQGP